MYKASLKIPSSFIITALIKLPHKYNSQFNNCYHNLWWNIQTEFASPTFPDDPLLPIRWRFARSLCIYQRGDECITVYLSSLPWRRETFQPMTTQNKINHPDPPQASTGFLIRKRSCRLCTSNPPLINPDHVKYLTCYDLSAAQELWQKGSLANVKS